MQAFDEYEEAASRTAKGLATTTIWYPALGLAGEAGEVAEKVKKLYRDTDYVESSKLTVDFRVDLVRELGDVLWYLTALARLAGVSLQNVAEENIAKLASRRERNMIHGSGDNR